MEPTTATISCHQRTILAIEVRIVARLFLGVVVWPFEDAEEGCCKLPDKSQSWLDVESGDVVLLFDEIRQVWVERCVESVRLLLANPAEFNGTIVESARSWLNDSPSQQSSAKRRVSG